MASGTHTARILLRVKAALTWLIDRARGAWDGVRALWQRLRKKGAGDPGAGSPVAGKIEHFFVLMLENRSFDHMFGFSDIAGLEKLSGAEGVAPTSDVVTTPDPPHEFLNVLEQLTGRRAAAYSGEYADDRNLTMKGFVSSYQTVVPPPPDPSNVVKAFSPEKLPVITALAKEFAICDHWFSSLPGPTWPNRFFVHAATSGGMDDSPTSLESGESYFKGYSYDAGTIFDRLEQWRRGSWRIYHGDDLPQTAALAGMSLKLLEDDEVRGFERFAEDVRAVRTPYAPLYTFIEPSYGDVFDSNRYFDFKGGSSQHPVDDVTRGEKLIKDVYETLRSSPLWERSCLVIIYDEHGGFFDHVPPPKCEPPGDSRGYNTRGFDFRRYGVRVPAVVVSPLIERGVVEKRVFDHASVVATVLRSVGLGALTNRDRRANAFDSLLTRAQPRDCLKTLPEPYRARFSVEALAPSEADDEAKRRADAASGLDQHLRNFVHLAATVDLAGDSTQEPRVRARVARIKTAKDAKEYLAEIKGRVNAKRKARQQARSAQ